MNRRDLPTLLADLEDLRGRLRDAQVPGDVLAHVTQAAVALRLEVLRKPTFPDERPSYAPRNIETRKTASEHFRRAREYAREATDVTSNAVRRIRRDS